MQTFIKGLLKITLWLREENAAFNKASSSAASLTNERGPVRHSTRGAGV